MGASDGGPPQSDLSLAGRASNLRAVSDQSLAFGDIVRVVEATETSERRIAGGIGMVVGVRIASASETIVGGGSLEDAVLVSLEEPVEETVLIASRLLEATGDTSEWEIVDGLAEDRADYEEAALAERVRVKATPETEALGLAGLVGEVMGETKPSSSGVQDIVGGDAADYAINAWFEERREQFWFHPDLLEPAGDDREAPRS